jgi:hypothetical protein
MASVAQKIIYYFLLRPSPFGIMNRLTFQREPFDAWENYPLSPVAPNEVPCGAIGVVTLPELVSGSVVVALSPVAPNEVPCGAIGVVTLPEPCAAVYWSKFVIRPRTTAGRINNIAIFILSIYSRSYKMLVLTLRMEPNH